ncbi:hypothetical protein DPMN_162141 [Dreissena polymorpha]|uniref:Uncharacterized protein n=1 Tax=Dreissena polymorpha TaxID=45954 RepID=A0A9D4ITA1_DREPO|nr:hypothetical protein DPMN_162141 [Dreissena polymorpha]
MVDGELGVHGVRVQRLVMLGFNKGTGSAIHLPRRNSVITVSGTLLMIAYACCKHVQVRNP